MKLAPTNAATAPVADAIEFIVTTCSRGTTWGRAADKPEETNRARPLTTSAPHSTSTLPAPTARQIPTRATDTSRPRLAPTSTSRRSQRSISAPANGPSSEYGKNSTAKAPAIANGSGGPLGVEQQRPGQAGLEESVAELACGAQFQQSPEVGQAAHRAPDSDRCARYESPNLLPRWGPAIRIDTVRASGPC